MASRMMHLAAAKLLLDMLPAGMDASRFMSGSIMVDSAPAERKASHFLTMVEGRKTYDTARFRDRYGHLLLTDGLVLGYYLHLVQDLVFRDELYHVHGFNPRMPGYLAGLHSDYRRLNQLLAKRFCLEADFDIPSDASPLDKIAAFDMLGLPGALAEDFSAPGEPEAFFFTQEMALGYISRAVHLCREELRALQNGLPLIDPKEWMWKADPV